MENRNPYQMTELLGSDPDTLSESLRVKPPPITATGLVDPCIVFIETSGARDLSLTLLACWARGSHEVKGEDRREVLVLDQVQLVKWCSRGRVAKQEQGENLNSVSLHQEPQLVVSSKLTKLRTELTVQSQIQYLNAESDQAIEEVWLRTKSAHLLAHKILSHGDLDWDSIREAKITVWK